MYLLKWGKKGVGGEEILWINICILDIYRLRFGIYVSGSVKKIVGIWV